jgi:ABC-type transporter MlaC component
VSRRLFVAGAAALVLPPSAFAKVHPSIVYMRRVGKDLLEAHRQGTTERFFKVIQEHADVPKIALYSLGPYKEYLRDEQRQQYYRGVANFMARYFADQSREYPVAKYEIGEAAPKDDGSISIVSKVYLLSGQTYTVTWTVAWRRRSYKVTDVSVLGFSLVYLQRGIFQSYLLKRNGDVAQLVAALNR